MLSMYYDADYATKETDRRPLSGVAVMYRSSSIKHQSYTKLCDLPTTKAEYVAMAERAKGCMFVREVLSFLRARIVLG